MDINYWIQIGISILSGIVVAIPLIIKLVEVVKNATKSKNWNLLIKMAIDYMKEAEKNIKSGAERKEWVINMVIASAININYPLTDEDIQKIEDLIDAICDASKIINNSEERNKALKEAKAKIKELEASEL